MLIDLLSQSNYGSYNIKLAHLFGLSASVYLTEIICINNKAINKNKVYPNGFFKVSRQYIMEKTTIESSNQKDLDLLFNEFDIVDIDSKDKNLIKINLDKLTSLVLDNNEELIELIKSKSTYITNKKMSKKEAISNMMKSYIVTDNDELRIAYYNWIDSVIENPKRTINKFTVLTFVSEIDKFANHDLDKALYTINKATINGWSEADWAINAAKKDYSLNSITTQHIASGVTKLSGSVY